MSSTLVEHAAHILTPRTNLSMTERTLSVVGGLALAAVGAKPRPNMWISLGAIVLGSALAIRGATGHCAVKSALSGSSPGAA